VSTRVSVIVPAYDEEAVIGLCLASLAHQTISDYEVIVVDDGSRDATPRIARNAGARVIATSHEGDCSARNAGAAVADGEVLVFCDADEEFAPEFLERLVEPLSDPEVRATFPGGVEWINADRGLAPGWLHIRGFPDPTRPPEFTTPHWMAKAVRRTDFERAGGYPEGGGYGADWVFGRAVGPAVVVREARWRFTLPATPGELFGKARWIGRSDPFDGKRISLPLTSSWRAARLLAKGHARAACARVLYDAGFLTGSVERRVRPGARNVA
jgi:glycosyltransferase involved in cell wall biosynthesis